MKTMLTCDLCAASSGHVEGATQQEAEDLCAETLRDRGWYEHRGTYGGWLCPECIDNVAAFAKETR